MGEFLHILTVLLVAVFLATTLGHALELPGKMRLAQQDYLKVQTIYWPGFTWIGGGAEVLGMLANLVLIFLTPDGVPLILVSGSLGLLIIAHAIYWGAIHPVNKVWVNSLDLKGASGGFFRAGGAASAADWTELRDRWEYAHAARAFLNFGSLAMLVIALAIVES